MSDVSLSELYARSDRPLCRKCFIEALGNADLTREISDYIASLPEEIKTGERDYRSRLAVCENCDSLADGICRYCGCFVEVRAVKRGLGCPHPEGDKWTARDI